MYKNRIRHTTPKGHPKFFIRRSEIAFEKRVRYIESVCQVLSESRFGSGRVEPVVVDFSDRPELRQTGFYDLHKDEPNVLNRIMPCYSISPLGRNRFQAIEDGDSRAKQMELVEFTPNARNYTAATKDAALLEPLGRKYFPCRHRDEQPL